MVGGVRVYQAARSGLVAVRVLLLSTIPQDAGILSLKHHDPDSGCAINRPGSWCELSFCS